MIKPTPYDFGAVGDGVADDTAAYQAWLDAIAGGAGYAAAGTFLISNTLYIKSGTTIDGSGRGTHIVKKSSSFPDGNGMLQNTDMPVALETYSNSDIAMNGVCFDGGNLTTSNALINFVGVSGLILRDCCFQHGRYILVAIGGCKGVTLDNNRFYDWAKLEVTEEGGPALWLAGGVSGETLDASVTNNYFVEGEWAGIYLSCKRASIVGNHFLNCKEAGIFGNPVGVTIANNQFENIKCKRISGHGVEIGGSNVIVDGNTFDTTDGESIHIAGVRYTVTNNICRMPGRDPVMFPGSSCIGVLSYYADVWPSFLLIANNILSDETGTTPYGILFARQNMPDSHKMNDVHVANNMFSGTSWTAAAIGILPDAATVVGANFTMEVNH